MSTTLEQLRTLLVHDYGLASDRLDADAPLEGLGIDSLGLVELLWSIEEAFRIKIPSTVVKLSTLGDLVGYIDALVARQPLRAQPGPATEQRARVA